MKQPRKATAEALRVKEYLKTYEKVFKIRDKEIENSIKRFRELNKKCNKAHKMLDMAGKYYQEELNQMQTIINNVEKRVKGRV